MSSKKQDNWENFVSLNNYNESLYSRLYNKHDANF